MYNKIKQFLSLLGDKYYVFGGKALSYILKNIESYDWDIIIDSRFETIDTVKGKLKSVFGDSVECYKQSLIRSERGTVNVIYGCKLEHNNIINDIIDTRFEVIEKDVPRIVVDNIIYLDIEKLYGNLNDSINDNYYLLNQYEEYYRRMSGDFMTKYINNEINDYDELLQELYDDPESDPEEIEEYIVHIEFLKSKEHYNQIINDLRFIISNSEEVKNKAIKLIRKNTFRLIKLNNSLKDPNNNFKPEYIKHLCDKCDKCDKLDIVKQIGKLKLKCNQLNC
jgi:hypothetical protein